VLLQLQNQILERIARGSPLQETIDVLCSETQRLAPGVLCSVLLVDGEGCLRPLSGPSLPDFYTKALNGVKIGPGVGSCGSAAYLRREVSVTNIQSDPLWIEFKSLAANAGLQACWSIPIVDGAGRVLGTFAFYYTEARGPGRIEKDIVSACVHLCAIAIEREERVKERQRLAFTDDLTKLGNRAAFNRKLESLSANISDWGLLLIDLDYLKTVNDTFGHEAGDELLQCVAGCLAAVAQEDCAFRVGGDEFAVVLTCIDAGNGLTEAAEKILNTLKTVPHSGRIDLSASIGGATLEGGGGDAANVKRHADLALYHAKSTGRGRFVMFFDGLAPSSEPRAFERRIWRQAFAGTNPAIFYRPIVNLINGQVEGAQLCCEPQTSNGSTLVRGRITRPLDATAAAIASLELIKAIFEDLQRIKTIETTLEFITVAMPLVAMRQATVYGELLQLAKSMHLSGRILYVQVTEAETSGHGRLHYDFEQLRLAGLRVALANFGSGRASLRDLLKLEPDLVSIDHSAVSKIGQMARADVIAEGLLSVARSLDVTIVADGVRNREQADRLLALGFRLGQGAYFNDSDDATTLSKLLTRSSASVRLSTELSVIEPRKVTLAPS
jgi:diguanylate cyclase (GGDEF)-like protein